MKSNETILKEKNLVCDDYEVLSNKDDVLVLRLTSMKDQPVLKCFNKAVYKREIDYYKLLSKLDIKTLEVLAYYEDALLLENIHFKEGYKLTDKKDLENEEVIKSLAKWYKDFHEKGRQYVIEHPGLKLYSEIKLLNLENISLLKERTSYKNNEFWQLLEKKLKPLLDYYHKHKTLTYNDFFYGNMLHSLDFHEAYMFDYNFLGLGLSYFDISNVLQGIEPGLHEVFIRAYGGFNSTEKEINGVFSHVIALILAYRHKSFPKWGEESLSLLESNVLFERLEILVLS